MKTEILFQERTFSRQDLFAASVLLVVLIVARVYSYLLFHSLAEIFSVVVAGGIFMLSWSGRKNIDNGSLVFLGIAYLFVGFLDLLHTLTYSGVEVFVDGGVNLPTQLWIGARSLEAVSLLVAPVLSRRLIRAGVVTSVYALLTGLFLASVLYWQVFPVCFVEGVGLTPFKIIMEYVISGILLAAGVLLTRFRAQYDTRVFRLLLVSILVTVGSELLFTLYAGPYDSFNALGHYLKLVSFYLIFKALIETAIVDPSRILYRALRSNIAERERIMEALRDSENKYRSLSYTLERKVEERTQVAQERARQLKRYALALSETEQQQRRRLADEVHNNLQQLNMAVLLRLRNLRQKTGNSVEGAVLDKCITLLERSVEEARKISVDLSPPILKDERLDNSLKWLAVWMKETYDFRVDLTVEKIVVDSEELRRFLFDAVKELLFNAVKHAGVNLARVTLESGGDNSVHIIVEDKGSGVDLAKLEEKREIVGGFGILSIRERIEVFGGMVRFDSAPGKGFLADMIVPLTVSADMSRPVAGIGI